MKTKVLKNTALIAALLVVTVSASCEAVANSRETVITNPQYMAQLSNTDAYSTTEKVSDLNDEIYVCKNYEELFNTVREQMLSRNMIFTVNYTGTAPDKVLNTETFRSFLDDIFAYDDPATSSDYDYLNLSWTSSRLSVESKDGFALYKFSFGYVTTNAEENEVELKTSEIIAKLNLGDSDIYSKIEAVNRYIVENVSYDKSMQDKSAYTAFIKGSAICRGYVLSAYKMLDGLDVPVRVITGKGNGQPHTWLIVEIDNCWYNLDITWNDQTRSNSFFLKNDKDFYFHKVDECFKTKTFTEEYPKAKNSY